MSSKAQNALEAFEDFLRGLDLESYGGKYRSTKTVEQDLPRELNPLPDLYEHYWKPNANHPFFPPFEEFFSQWWDRRLKPLDEFIRKYFWGCSYEFVRLGLEARLYRTAISIWTQFHFCYRWQASCTLSLQAAPELDSQGIDALIQVRAEHLVGIQIKKESYRKEARGENRFVRKRQIVSALLEIPYTLQTREELQKRANHAKTRKETYLLWLQVANHLEHLPNNFVIFRESYVRRIEDFLQRNATLTGLIPWEKVVQEALTAP
ncbi:restriction endonuclease [Thermus scotoductus]|uniref:Restriction endonuclease n=2 Tax=Thermus TaxID=270 RepID=A0A430UVL3_THESC|nr:TaqI family restriction endonuclease [Thermus scotoductus]AAC45744.1 endonuclease R.Tsp32I [Thermus sp. SM32]RTI13152.1 restriction endonuclease [Thermus scotoductus]